MKSNSTSTFTSTRAALVCGIAVLAMPASVSAQLQWADTSAETTADTTLTVTGMLHDELSNLPEGPEIDGFISARSDNRIQVTTEDGAKTVVFVSPETEIKARGGFLGPQLRLEERRRTDQRPWSKARLLLKLPGVGVPLPHRGPPKLGFVGPARAGGFAPDAAEAKLEVVEGFFNLGLERFGVDVVLLHVAFDYSLEHLLHPFSQAVHCLG